MSKSNLRAELALLLAASNVPVTYVAEGMCALNDQVIFNGFMREVRETEQRLAHEGFSRAYYQDKVDLGCWYESGEEVPDAVDPLAPVVNRTRPVLSDEYDMIERLRDNHSPFGDAEAY